MVHWPDVNTAQQETLETLVDIQRKGKIRHIGVSNYSLEQMKEASRYGKFISLQPEYNLLSRSIEAEVVPWCLANGVGIVAYSPLASGVLTGKYDKATRFKDWRSKGVIGNVVISAVLFPLLMLGGSFFPSEAMPGWMAQVGRWTPNGWAVERLKALADSAGRTAGQLAINWVLRQPGVATALVGVKNERQIEENVSAAGWAPDPEIDARLNEVFARA